MDFKEIEFFFNEICFKGLNGMKLTDTESEFLQAYFALSFWAQDLSNERQEQLKKFIKRFAILD